MMELHSRTRLASCSTSTRRSRVHQPPVEPLEMPTGHLEGLLDRDQRTVSTSKFDNMIAEQIVTAGDSQCRCRAATRRRLRKHRHHICSAHPFFGSNRWHALRRTLHRLGEVLVVGVCLLSAVRVPPVMSAPLGSLDARFTSRPKWVNPCGLGGLHDDTVEDLVDYRATDQELVDRIILQARNAFMHADMFKELYVQKTFNSGFTEWHETWKTKHYDWLPSRDQIPKGLGETTSEDHLHILELDAALKDIYEYLQKYAVGLEQIVWDQDDENGDFKVNFEDLEYKLRATLCEVQVAMLERSVKARDDIKREVMPSDIRSIGNSSYRNLRDWIIYRDYMNGLEYVIQALEYLKQKVVS